MEAVASYSKFWQRARVAGVHHLIDLKRAGHSPSRTERGYVERPFIVPPPPVAVEEVVAEPTPSEPTAPPLGDQHDAHVRIFRQSPRRTPAIELIIAATERRFGVSAANIVGHRRLGLFVRPRQIAMYLAREMTGRSLLNIGRQFGGRDHTTVLSGIRQTASRKDIPEYRDVIAAIRADVEANWRRLS